MRKGATFRKFKKERETLREKVFSFIQKNEPICTNDVIVRLRMKHQTATARLSELEQEGRIYQRGVIKKENKRAHTIWGITPLELVQVRKVENWNKRLNLWLAKGQRNGFVAKKDLANLKKQNVLF